jgi:glycosyltransferase involved in cell wall biosynthesis
MDISIITVTLNSAATISDCCESVSSQAYPAEHVIIDGASTDNTLEIVRRLSSPATRILSEPDNGIYDAMNKGIRLASGDVIGILNSDDFYVNNQVLAKVIHIFDTQPIDALFADLVFVKPNNLDKIVRYYSGAKFSLSKFASGWNPPHPTFFVRRECYEKYGLFKTDYNIAGDFELMARFMVKHNIRYHYLPEVIIKMRTGGVSTRNFKSNIILNREILRACAENGVKTNIFKVYMKYFTKIFQLLERPA